MIAPKIRSIVCKSKIYSSFPKPKVKLNKMIADPIKLPMIKDKTYIPPSKLLSQNKSPKKNRAKYPC